MYLYIYTFIYIYIYIERERERGMHKVGKAAADKEGVHELDDASDVGCVVVGVRASHAALDLAHERHQFHLRVDSFV